jgi:acetoin utilization deacetylase AcuC-like enzyme
MPLPENIDGATHRKSLREALKRITRFRPEYLVVPLGLDTAKEDPTGTWTLVAPDFEEMGRLIGAMRLPTLVVQEGGYDTRVLGINARSFFTGLWSATYQR